MEFQASAGILANKPAFLNVAVVIERFPENAQMVGVVRRLSGTRYQIYSVSVFPRSRAKATSPASVDSCAARCVMVHNPLHD